MWTGDEQLACSAYGHTMQVLIDDEEPEVIQRFADRDILLLLVYRIGRREDRTLGRTVRVMKQVVSRRRDSRKFFSSHRQVLEGMIVAVLCKLIADLGRHERMGDTFGFEIMIEIRQVESDILADDIDCCTASERRVHVHHVRIETVRSVRRHFVSGMEVIIAMVPMTERHKVAVLELAAFGHARGAGGIKEDE